MLYIKFKEWDIKSLKIACREAERLWYVEYDSSIAIDFEWIWILKLDSMKVYYTTKYSEEEIIKQWFKHHKINPLRKLYYYLTT